MASFAERIGLKSPRTLVQLDGLDQETRVALWNVLFTLRGAFSNMRERAYSRDDSEQLFLDAIWAYYFEQARDERPHDSKVWQRMKARVLGGEWYEALEIVEESVGYLQKGRTTKPLVGRATDEFNLVFERYLVGFRFIDERVTPLDSTEDAEAVRLALDDSTIIAGARHHLGQAVEHLADRINPDYANSIKESISAVEAITKKVTGETTLSAGLKKLEISGLTIHPAWQIV